jgi:iron complex outermembrane receptor protein
MLDRIPPQDATSHLIEGRRMARARHVRCAFIAGLLATARLGAQEPTSGINGLVIDATTQLPLGGVGIAVEGTQRQTFTRPDGVFVLSGLPAGTYRLRATRIGYGPQQQDVTVGSGATVTVQFALQPQAALLEEVVVTGYGEQRREAITGSVATLDGGEADVGVVSNVNRMLQGRIAGVNITVNSGEPGAGAQVRIRGGTSISASNEPLYVVDGVPLNNVEAEAPGFGIGGSPPLPRSPLNLLNPSDIASITVLKDAAATSIYGSRAANGVILIETKKGGRAGPATMEYDGYVAMATRARYLDLLTGAEYDQFVRQKVRDGDLALDTTNALVLGGANTDWERAVSRTAVTHNHNLSFTGGSEATRYRASLNYMNQEGAVIANGFERLQGRLNATHRAFDDRLRLGLNVTASHIENDYLPFENTGGFEGGVFQNVAVFNPTYPIRNATTGAYFEVGGGRQSVRNPVALANQILDFGNTTRTLGNAMVELDLLAGVTGQVNVGVDRSGSTRRIYLPLSSPVGAEWSGRAEQKGRENSAVTLQTLLTLRRQFGTHGLDVVGGYEFSDYSTAEFGAFAQEFVTDAFGYNNLGGGNTLLKPYSWREDSRFVSFFGRANYSLRDRYFLTWVTRYDGSSRFGEGKKWALFPAVSASWRLSEEAFMSGRPLGFSDLRLRVGWGLQGNPGVPPYASQILLEPSGGARYVFGEQAVTGIAPVRNPNPDLKWEQTAQYNVALDFGFLDNRFSGSLEYYVKNTSDLILDVPVPPPAPVPTRLENVGQIRNRGVELSLDAVILSRPDLTWRAGLAVAAERNKVIDLGPHTLINTGFVSGQGQSGQVSQRIMPGHPLGTFFGAEFVRVNAQGQQLFRCVPSGPTDTRCVNGETTSPQAQDYRVIGHANPDFTVGLHSQVTRGKLDLNFLIRGVIGQDVFNNTALVYATQSNAKQSKNFLRSALNDPTGIDEPAIYSSRWIEDASFVRLENVTLEYQVDLPLLAGSGRATRVYISGDNLILLTGYSGLDPEVHAESGLASRGIDYLSYPRPRSVTAGVRVAF